MQRYFKRLPADIRKILQAVALIAKAKGLRAYLVGGFVRDLFGARQNLDVDIVIVGDALPVARQFASDAGAGLTVHSRFGTATVQPRRGGKVDFASARKESYPYPGSLPIVSPGSLRDDLARRDFTINTMAVGLVDTGFGKLIDFFCAREDMRRKKIRVLHDASFIDDPTRIMRAIRFEQRFGFRITPRTLKLLKAAVAAGMLGRVNPQRIRDELIALLKEPEPLKSARRMRTLSGLGFIHPGLTVTGTTGKLFAAVARERAWLEQHRASHPEPQAWLLYFMVLIDPLSEAQAAAVCKKFVFRKEEQQTIVDYKRMGAHVGCVLREEVLKPSQVYAVCAPFDDAVLLMIKAKYGSPGVKKNIVDYLCKYKDARALISGEDLKRLGLKPGRRYQVILDSVLHARLDGRLTSRKDELAYVKTMEMI